VASQDRFHERKEFVQSEIPLKLIAPGKHQKCISRLVLPAAIQWNQVARLDEPRVADDRARIDMFQLYGVKVLSGADGMFYEP